MPYSVYYIIFKPTNNVFIPKTLTGFVAATAMPIEPFTEILLKQQLPVDPIIVIFIHQRFPNNKPVPNIDAQSTYWSFGQAE